MPLRDLIGCLARVPLGNAAPAPDWVKSDTGQVAHSPVDIAEKLSLFSQHWSPKTVARLNDYEIKVVKVRGEFTWHTHQEADEVAHGRPVVVEA